MKSRSAQEISDILGDLMGSEPKVVQFPAPRLAGAQRAIADLAPLSRWIAWRPEAQANSLMRKVPYSAHHTEHAANNRSADWSCLASAEVRAKALGHPDYVGLILGPSAPGRCIGGIDLDGCLDASGAVSTWAQAILDRFDSYAEVSPSGRGLKIFFEYDPSDLPRLRAAFPAGRGGDWGPSFAQAHVGPEIHLGGRWYAVTRHHQTGTPSAIRPVSSDAIVWLLAEHGPAFEAAQKAGGKVDKSGILFGIACQLHREGADFEAFSQAAMADPEAAEHIRNNARSDRQRRSFLERQWCRAGGKVEAAQQAMAESLLLEANGLEDLEPLSDTPATPSNSGDWHVAAFAADGEPDLSDDQLAIDLGRAGWNRDARYCAPMGGWLLWDGHRWQPASGMKPMAIVRAYLRAKATNLTTWAEQHAKTLAEKDAEKLLSWAKAQNKALRSDPKIAAIERTTRSNPRSLIQPEQFDASDFILGTPGGTVDLLTGTLREARRGDYVTKLTAVAPAEDGTRPEAWLSYLAACFPDNPEIPEFLQRLAGYALTGSTREHKAFFFHGDGRNGKGSFLNLLEWLMGDYSANVATSVLLESRNPQHSSPLAMLRGARLARGSEISGGSAWDESILKRLTGGDPITANLMRQDSITFTPKLTLIIDANRRPRIRTVDAAMKARIVLVPWRQSFAGREDRTLGDRLKAEGPAILRWAIEGAVAWHHSGLGIPASIAAASHDYLETEDDLGQFLEDCVVVEQDARVRATALFRRFTTWQEEQGIRAAWSQRALAGAMVERGFGHFKDRAGRGFVGLRLPDHANLLDAPEA